MFTLKSFRGLLGSNSSKLICFCYKSLEVHKNTLRIIGKNPEIQTHDILSRLCPCCKYLKIRRRIKSAIRRSVSFKRSFKCVLDVFCSLPEVKPSECMRLRSNLRNSKIRGAYIPQCTPGGEFNPVQCTDSKEPLEECFCVDILGQEVPGTRSRHPKRPDCSNIGEIPQKRKL